MFDVSDYNDEAFQKFNKNQYRTRFGISYTNINRKNFDFTAIKKKSKKYSKAFMNSSMDNSKLNSALNNDSSTHNKSSNLIIYNEAEQLEIEKIYGTNEKDYDEILPIHNFDRVTKCSVLKYGIKKSTEEIEYSYCKTCDYNLLKPICICCINQCHKGHIIKYIFNKGRIKCYCGEINHIGMKLNNNNDNNDINCLCNEWNLIAKLNFYYENKNQEPLCILCHYYCQKDNKDDKIVKISKDVEIPKCSCKNEEIHSDNRVICEKILDLIKKSTEFEVLLHPVQVMNMIFRSSNNFKLIFEYFDLFTNNINNSENISKIIANFSKAHSADITYTNIFKTLLIFENIIKKGSINNFMCYYNEEVVNYFSFHTIKKLLISLKKSSIEEKLFWALTNKYLYLFHKIYINIKTLFLVKFKVNDLKNLSLCQRMIIFNENSKRFKESEEIISFLIKFLVDIIYKRFSLDSIDCIRQIISIFRKLSCYNLIRIRHMTQICISISKCFNSIRIIRNSFTKNINANNNDVKSKNDYFYFNKITLKLYYIIIKMFLNFIYNYNDTVVNRIINDKEKYPDINYIDFENVCFLYSKNEFGRLMFKITLYILATIQKNYKDVENIRIILIQRIGMEILQYSLNKNDNYYLNMIGSLRKFKYYFQKNQISIIHINNNKYYKELLRQSNLITNCFYQYFNFEITIDELIEVINDSLNFVLGDSVNNILKFDGSQIEKKFNLDEKNAILSTNYYTLLSKVISILNHHQNRKEIYEKRIGEQNEINKANKEINNFIDYIPLNIEDEIIKKILFFYFCFISNSPDNSFLILSFYIFIEIIKLPIKYSQIIFKLFYDCIKNIENNIVIVEQSYIIKRLFNYLEKLINKKSEFNPNSLLFCVYYYLQILEIIVFNLQPSSFNVFIYKIQFILSSLNQRYSIINKFFNMKESELNIQGSGPKNLNNRSDKKVNPFKKEPIKEKKSISNTNIKTYSIMSEFSKKNILKKAFLIYIKLINDCYDFSIDNDRQKINEIIDVEKVIFAIKNYKLSLDLRTELLRFLRKAMLDLKWDFNENRLFAEIIINNEDNLSYMKNNPLVNNSEYPTRFLSFLNDFYNISAKCGIKEKIERKMYEKKKIEFESNQFLIEDEKKELNENCDISDSERGNFKESGFFEEFNYNRTKVSKSFLIPKNYKIEFDKIKNVLIDKGKRFSLANNDKSLNFNRKKYSLEVGDNIKLNANYGNRSKILMNNTEIISELNSDEEKSLKDGKIISKNDIKENSIGYNILKSTLNLDKNKFLKLTNDVIPEEISSKYNDNDIEESYLKTSELKSQNKSNKSIVKLNYNEGNNSKNNLSPSHLNEKIVSKKTQSSLSPSSKTSQSKKNKINKNKSKITFSENDLNSEDFDELEDAIEENNNEEFYLKCKEMDILENAFNEQFYDVINNELTNYKKNMENITLNCQEKIVYLRNYIENGLLIPIIYYFKKIFTLANLFTGNEMIKLYSLIEKCIHLKLYLLEYKSDLWKDCINDEHIVVSDNTNMQSIFFDNDEIINTQYYYYTNYKYPSIIDGTHFVNKKKLHLTENSLDFLKSNKNSLFDYSLLYQIMEKEFFCLLKDKKVLNVSYNFKEKNNYGDLNKKKIREEEKILNEKKNYKSEMQKRLLKLIIIYKHNKLACYNENNSSFFSVLSEISLEYEESYRSLLLNVLIEYGKDMNLKNEFMDNSYYLLFKLLCLQTVETQTEIMNILGGADSEECGFLDEYSQILFYRIILLFLDYFNPPDKLIQSNYFVSCNLLNIFKFLCVKHNYFFQFHIVKYLSYTYSENAYSFFKFNIEKFSKPSKEKKECEETNSNKKNKIMMYNIKFYDFLLFLLTKIILISNWDNYNDNNQPNQFLYDLFSSILDLLTEIIQGSKPELLSILFDNVDEKLFELIGYGIDIEKFKKNESFENFIKFIANILFQENNTKLIHEIKKNLIYFITSILEEKNDNEIMKKCIKKYLNINNIYRNISKIMKSYYLINIEPKKLEKENKLEYLIPHRFSVFKNPKEINKRRSTVATFKPRMKSKSIFIDKKMKPININNNETSSSNVKLINTIIDVNMDLKKNLFISNLKKKNKNNKKIISIDDNILKETKTTYEPINKNDSMAMELKLSKLIFGKNLYTFFKKQFYEEPKFIETLEFKLCNSFYRFIKIIKMKKKIKKKGKNDKKNKLKDLNLEAILFKDEEVVIKNKFSKKMNIKDSENYEKDAFEKFYISKFFEEITKILEIRTYDKINKTIIYTQLPEMKYLSKGTKIELIKNVNRDNETSKKYDLMRYVEYFFKEIKYNNKYNNKWDIWLSKTNYYILERLSYAFALMYNFFLLFTIKGDTQITTNDTLKERIQNKIKIENIINNSIKEWNIIYDVINWVYLVLNGVFIVIWMRYKLPLYYRLDKVKYKDLFKKDKNKKLNIFEKIYVIINMCILGRNYISMLIYEFIVCIICIIIKNSEIFYGFFLLPIFYINKTLKSLVISIQLNFKQFCVTFSFTFMLIYIFTNIYYYFFNSDFVAELNYYKDNYCKTLIFAILNALDYGLRARGGLADSAIRVSFSREKSHYLKRLMIDDLFFLLIVIIMIDMVFGIVIKSFDELRHSNQKYTNDKLNNCFICHSNRHLLDKMRINFHEHVTNNHNVWNYVEYMISLKLKDIHDLSAINQYVRAKMEKKDISWLPSYRDMNKDNDINLDDKNLLVFHENVNDYKLKSMIDKTLTNI